MSNLNDDAPLFSKQKINFQPSSAIVHMASSNSVIVLTTENGKLLRIPKDVEKQIEMDMVKVPGDRIAYVHLDPSGVHLIISMSSGEVFYADPTIKQPKMLPKLKGHVITAVAWNSIYSKDNTTSFILLGTAKGELIECEILQGGTTSYVTQVYSFIEEVPTPVTSVFMHSCSDNEKRWLIFVTTYGQLLPFAGEIGNPTDNPVLTSIFRSSSDSGRSLTLPVATNNEMDDNSKLLSQLHVFPVWSHSSVSYIAWLEKSGIQHGTIDDTAKDPYNMFKNQKFYWHPQANGRHDVPRGIVLTEYHIMILYADRVVCMCIFDESIVFEERLGPSFGEPTGICRDAVSGIVYVYTRSSVLRYKATDERKYLWSIFLNMGDFIRARKFASNNPKNLDVVLRRQAQKLFEEKKYPAAAEMFALTQASFEEISLKFIEGDDRTSLKIYLQKKLDGLAATDRTRKALLIFWLLEIFLTEMAELKSGVHSHTAQSTTADSSDSKSDPIQRYKMMRSQFYVFLNRSDVKECVESNYDAVVRLMSDHGDMDMLLYFSEMTKNFHIVLTIYLQQQQYEEAVNVLTKQANVSLFYKFSPYLMPFVPAKLVDAWINEELSLEPVKLLPALFQCNRKEKLAKEALRYLEFCIMKLDVIDQSLHNLLLSLYANFQPEKLMPYLKSQGDDGSSVSYDAKYALRLFMEKKLYEPAVYVYCTMGLFEEAVGLALKVDVHLAKRCASVPEDNIELKRKLWLSVARHIVEDQQDIKKSMELLQESDGLIKIQDLLPFFPDFATIEHFKEPLCNFLVERSNKIKTLKDEMKVATEVAKQINQEIKTATSRYTIVRTQDKCASCAKAIISRGFFTFPCRHNFHADCLESEFLLLATPEEKQRLKDLRRRLNKMDRVSETVEITSSQSQLSIDKTNSQDEMDELVASECPFCGMLAIRVINRPFLTPAEYMQQQEYWS